MSLCWASYSCANGMTCLPTQQQLLLQVSVGQEGAFRLISRFLELTWSRRSAAWRRSTALVRSSCADMFNASGFWSFLRSCHLALLPWKPVAWPITLAGFCLQFGHEPRLMSPHYVRPYVKVHKNDDQNAEGIAEAATRPTMSFVPIKTEGELDL